MLIRALWLALLFTRPVIGIAQDVPGSSDVPTIKAATSIVLVPTILSDPSGNPVEVTDGQLFKVFDDGVPVKVFGESAGKQPLAVVVVLQTGGSAPALFQNYEHLATLLHSALGSTPHELSLVTFDSHPHKTATFPLHFDYLEHAMTHPDAGDKGAAILDAVNVGLDLFAREPANYKRVLILLSQPNDVGSTTAPPLLLQKIAETGATVYSFSFPGSKKASRKKAIQKADEALGGSSHADPKTSAALAEAIDAESGAMKTNSGHALAVLSGGEAFQIQELETGFDYLRNALLRTYILSFSPVSRTEGIHLIQVKPPAELQSLKVRARLFYWGPTHNQLVSVGRANR